MTETTQEEYYAALKDQCQAWVSEAIGLRVTPDISDDPHEVDASLKVVRGNLDRLETLLSMAMALRAGAATNARKKGEVAEDAWDKLADQTNRRGGREDYQGAQERYATWRLATHEQRKNQRVAQSVLELARDAEDRIKLAHRGLDGVRQDLNSRIRLLTQWEAARERT